MQPGGMADLFHSFVHKALFCLALAAVTAFGYEIPFGEGTAAGVTDFYLVPSGYGRLTFKYAGIPVIDFRGNGSVWRSAGDVAIATATGDGTITVRHRDFMKAGEAVLVFKGGHLVSFSRNGSEEQRKKDIHALCMRADKQPTLPQLWRVSTEEQAEESKALWWRDTRLRLGYFNPNAAGTLFAELAVLFFAFAFLVRRRWVRIASVVAALPMLYGVVLTGSRGSFLAFIVGVVVLVACRLCRAAVRRPKVLLFIVAAVLLCVGGLFALNSATHGRFGSNLFAVDASNVQRLRAWGAVPEMMATAPGGWGAEPGRAYCDWFQDLTDQHRLYYLISSHLTWLVQHGRLFRCVYVSSWLAFLLVLFVYAGKRVAQLSLAVWMSFAVSLWFSTVGIFATLWIVPVLCGGAALFVIGCSLIRKPQEHGRRVLAVLGVAVAVGCFVPFFLEHVGNNRRLAKNALPISYDGRTIRLGDGEAQIAIIRDSFVLGGRSVGSFGHELREWMLRNPNEGTVLVVDDSASLPENVGRLVAAGKGGARYLKHRSEHLDDGKFCDARKTVFLSPSFPLTAIPYTLLQRTDVRLFIGEFAALREESYSRNRPWVKVVPACELYIPGWTDLALSDSSGGIR